MKPLAIFRPGRHTAANGVALDFSEEQVRATVDAYDPKLHEAPIVVGHPKDDSPAYGWIEKLNADEQGHMNATPHQVMPEFAEAVEAGRWKKRSAAFYHPDSPSNPVPGVFYLKHVGFLGGKPPAVKGMPDPAFGEQHPLEDQGVVVYEESFVEPGPLANIFRRLREYLIEREGTETADSVIPAFHVEDLEQEARNPGEDNPEPGFADPGQPDTPEEDSKMDEQKEKRLADLEAKEAQFSERENTVAEREKAIELREQEIAKAEVAKRIDALVDQGRVLPAQRDRQVAFAMALDSEPVIEFGEGDKAEKISRREEHLRMLAEQPPQVPFGEHSGPKPGAGAASEGEIARRARAYRAQMANAGTEISFTEAYDAVSNGADVEAESA